MMRNFFQTQSLFYHCFKLFDGACSSLTLLEWRQDIWPVKILHRLGNPYEIFGNHWRNHLHLVLQISTSTWQNYVLWSRYCTILHFYEVLKFQCMFFYVCVCLCDFVISWYSVDYVMQLHCIPSHPIPSWWMQYMYSCYNYYVNEGQHTVLQGPTWQCSVHRCRPQSFIRPHVSRQVGASSVHGSSKPENIITFIIIVPWSNNNFIIFICGLYTMTWTFLRNAILWHSWIFVLLLYLHKKNSFTQIMINSVTHGHTCKICTDETKTVLLHSII